MAEEVIQLHLKKGPLGPFLVSTLLKESNFVVNSQLPYESDIFPRPTRKIGDLLSAKSGHFDVATELKVIQTPLSVCLQLIAIWTAGTARGTVQLLWQSAIVK